MQKQLATESDQNKNVDLIKIFNQRAYQITREEMGRKVGRERVPVETQGRRERRVVKEEGMEVEEEQWNVLSEEEQNRRKKELIQSIEEGRESEGKGVYQKVVLQYLKSREREAGRDLGEELLKECEGSSK